MTLRPLIAATALLLAGCATIPPPKAGAWALQASATAGAALVRTDNQGRDALRIACRRNPADLYVASDLAEPATGQIALTVDDRAFPLTARGEEPRLSATGPLPDGLPAALMSARRVALSYGGRRLGPFPAPDAKTAAAFAIGCRGPTGRRAGAGPG
ncbi:MAG: hypothetical protein JWO33_638 [Caulobacteraceae bacterium]|nr:hypothetical protein [Caulobacteraceae bacterium]